MSATFAAVIFANKARFHEKFATEVATIDGYDDEQAALNGIIAQIGMAITIQATDDGGVAQNKLNLRVAMAKLIVTYASRGMVKAKRAGNTELAVELAKPERYFILGTADEGISRANAMIKLINGIPEPVFRHHTWQFRAFSFSAVFDY